MFAGGVRTAVTTMMAI